MKIKYKTLFSIYGTISVHYLHTQEKETKFKQDLYTSDYSVISFMGMPIRSIKSLLQTKWTNGKTFKIVYLMIFVI